MNEETISLKEIIELVKKRIGIIISITVITMLIALSVSLFVITPIYQASSQFIVNQKVAENEVDANTIRTNVEMINTYNEIIKSPTILNEVIESLSLDSTAASLAGSLTVSSEQNSQVVTVSVENPSQSEAASIANEIVSTFQKEIPDIMNIDNVSILTVAEHLDDPSPVKPNVTLNTAIGLVLGLMLGLGLAFLLEYFDTTVKTVEDIKKITDVPVIGQVSTIELDDLRNVNKQE